MLRSNRPTQTLFLSDRQPRREHRRVDLSTGLYTRASEQRRDRSHTRAPLQGGRRLRAASHRAGTYSVSLQFKLRTI